MDVLGGKEADARTQYQRWSDSTWWLREDIKKGLIWYNRTKCGWVGSGRPKLL